MQELKYSDSVSTEILNDIFGCREGSTSSEGLIDCSNSEEFNEKMILMKDRWNQAGASDFYKWFLQYKAFTMKTTMLKDVREDAGLGTPPEIFTTNASETINSVIKSHLSHKSSKHIELIDKLKEVIDDQELEVEKAIIGRGKYQLKEQYSHLMIEETDWFKLSKAERSRHLKKVMGTAITLESPELSLTSTVLSMDAETASEFVSIPLPVLDGIWVKASSLVAHQDNISSAPGYPHGCKMVKSYSGKRPHLVYIWEEWSF